MTHKDRAIHERLMEYEFSILSGLNVLSYCKLCQIFGGCEKCYLNGMNKNHFIKCETKARTGIIHYYEFPNGKISSNPFHDFADHSFYMKNIKIRYKELIKHLERY